MAESPVRKACGASAESRESASAVKSPRLLAAKLCTSSTITARKPENSAAASDAESISIRLSGVVRNTLGGLRRWRARLGAGVSPVRLSTVTPSPISAMGRIKLRSMSLVSAFSGEM